MRNPFHFNRPTPPEDFLGRHTIVEQMVDDLYDWEGESYGVVGGRRFGKSSLLLALENSLVKRFRQVEVKNLSVIPVYVPLKALSVEGPTHVFGFILHQLLTVNLNGTIWLFIHADFCRPRLKTDVGGWPDARG